MRVTLDVFDITQLYTDSTFVIVLYCVLYKIAF